jgi:hypothetical protein
MYVRRTFAGRAMIKKPDQRAILDRHRRLGGKGERVMAKRTDFCMPDCSCAKDGEVICLKLLPAINEWNGQKIDETSYRDLVTALNKMWERTR